MSKRHPKVECICAHCSIEFKKHHYTIKPGKDVFCSKECYTANTTSICVCGYCNKTFQRPNSLIKGKAKVFCNSKCYRAFTSLNKKPKQKRKKSPRKRESYVCKFCELPFTKIAENYKNKITDYCSRGCAFKAKGIPSKCGVGAKIGCYCSNCGKSFLTRLTSLKTRISLCEGRKDPFTIFCGRSCASEDLSATAELLEISCSYCKEAFTKRAAVYNAHLKENPDKGTYCSKRCFAKQKKFWADEALEERFWSLVDKTPGLGSESMGKSCWEWKGTVTFSGYGVISWKKKQHKATKISYWLTYGRMANWEEKSEILCHHCDHRICVNPEHIYIGSNKSNNQDKVLRKRHHYGSRFKGAKLDERSVTELRILRCADPEQYSVKELQRIFGIKSQVGNILKYKVWAYTPRPYEEAYMGSFVPEAKIPK